MTRFSKQQRDSSGATALPPDDDAAVVVMAKRPKVGRVKTRMVPPLTERQAAEVHTAMLRCVLARLERFVPGRKVLALDAAEAELRDREAALRGVDLSAWTLVPQGAGDLGERLLRVWQALGGGAVAFFGVDSPDVPAEMLAGLWGVLEQAEAAAGPTEDGGYWTLLVRRTHPHLLAGIDWGTAAVYDQTRRAAVSAGLTWGELPRWYDVDDALDLADLQHRLAQHGRESPADPALRELITPLASRDLFIESEKPAMTDSLTATASARAGTEDPSPPTAADKTPAGEQAALDDSRILIVDDNEQNVELLQAYLEALSCDVEVAYDGQAALDRIDDPDRPRPDLILLDVMMPKMSGFEVCRKLKDDPATRSIPIMMVTALNELGDIERGVESGTDDFVTKPVNRLELLTRCKSLLRMRQLKRELERTEAHLRDLEGRRGDE